MSGGILLVVIALVVLAAVIVCAIGALWRGDEVAIFGLVVSSMVWTLVSGPFEGALVYRIDSQHGITTADFLTVIGLVIAGYVAFRERRAHKVH